MSDFRFPKGADPNKMFLINSSELEGRLDPYFYKPEFLKNKEQLKTIGCVKLSSQSVAIFSGITPKSGGDAYCDKDIGVPFIRSGDFLEEGNIDFSNVLYIKPSIHNGLMKSSKVKKNDVLVAIVGATIGKVGIYRDNKSANINQAIATVRLKQGVKPEYLRAFLLTSLGQKMIDRVKRPVARANINLDEVGAFDVPNLSFSKQDSIIAKMEAAYKAKRSKEAEAQGWLDSIDDYLLQELGIEKPKQIDNLLEERIFVRRFSNVSGKRFDPAMVLYKSKLSSSQYALVRLGNLTKRGPQYGANEIGLDRHSLDEPRYIRITDIDSYGILKDDIGKTAKIIDSKYMLNFNDLLIARSGSVGRAYIHKETGYVSIFAGYMIRFVINEKKANPDYIFFYMHSSLYHEWVHAIQRTVVQSNINAEEYKSLEIPLPTLEKQKKIAEFISRIREQAKKLNQEADADIEKAKREVEEMILKKK